MPSLKIHKDNEDFLHFMTFTTIEWIDVFTNNKYFEVLLESMQYCKNNLGLKVYAYAIMTNHVHVIWQARKGYSLIQIVQSFKRQTTKDIKQVIRLDSRKYILGLIKTSKYKRSSFQLWQENNYPEVIEDEKFMKVKLDYIHNNPVKKGYVSRPESWQYSSASNYAGEKVNAFNVDLFEFL